MVWFLNFPRSKDRAFFIFLKRNNFTCKENVKITSDVPYIGQFMYCFSKVQKDYSRKYNKKKYSSNLST